jgi:hypothetical protein
MGTWNVRNVTTMCAMFRKGIKFNQSLSTWTVTQVRDIYGIYVTQPYNHGMSVRHVQDMIDLINDWRAN